MKFENIRVMNFENALRGMRNPKESYNRIDSEYGFETIEHIKQKNCAEENKYTILHTSGDFCEYAAIGPNDMKLAQTLIKAGPEHRKFMRQIFVSVDITAPLFWWKEFDTYKVGTVANSTSTMHKITAKPITIDNFETGDWDKTLEWIGEVAEDETIGIRMIDFSKDMIIALEGLRTRYLRLIEVANQDTTPSDEKEHLIKEAKLAWKELIRWIPESWLQTRTVTLNYENLLAICSKSQRRFHKLVEWSESNEENPNPSFIKFARSLPYAQEFIFIDELETVKRATV